MFLDLVFRDPSTNVQGFRELYHFCILVALVIEPFKVQSQRHWSAVKGILTLSSGFIFAAVNASCQVSNTSSTLKIRYLLTSGMCTCQLIVLWTQLWDIFRRYFQLQHQVTILGMNQTNCLSFCNLSMQIYFAYSRRISGTKPLSFALFYPRP